jgi:hypothetical protein
MRVRGLDSKLARLNGSGSRSDRKILAELAKAREGLAYWLLEAYRKSTKWKVRRGCIYYALAANCSGSHAVSLARLALKDRSRYVRGRAYELCAFLAVRELLPDLRQIRQATVEGEEAGDVRAAIDAIESGNPHYFLDREHTGTMKIYRAEEFLELLEKGEDP